MRKEKKSEIGRKKDIKEKKKGRIYSIIEQDIIGQEKIKERSDRQGNYNKNKQV